MEEFGKPPRAMLSISVHEAYFHCGKALMRSKLWSSGRRRSNARCFPSISQVIHDQTRLGEPECPGRGRGALQDAAVGR